VTDEIVERPEALVHVQDAGLLQADVAQLQRVHVGLACGDLASGQINAHEPALRQRQGHRNEIAPAGTAKLEHSAGCDARGLEAVQPTHNREIVRLGPVERFAWIRNNVVAGQRRAAHVSSQHHGNGVGQSPSPDPRDR
jgi:hypothetical protein